MQTYIVNNTDDFHKYYPLLKNTAAIGSTPDIYLVGFDIETFSKDNFPQSFNKAIEWLPNANNANNTNINTIVCLIQLASDKVCLIINLVKLKGVLPKKLINIIKNDSWVKVGVGIELDLANISNNYNLGHCSGGIEVRNLALMAHYTKPNLEFMFSQFVGTYVKKTSSICDWSQELSQEQLLYAAKDAIMSLEVFKYIIKPSIDNLTKIKNDNDTKIKDILTIDFQNLNTVQNTIQNTIKNTIQNTIQNTIHNDIVDQHNVNTINYVGILNEYAQKHKIKLPLYEDIMINDMKLHQQHRESFKCTCKYLDHIIEGVGATKKDAKQNAAKQMYNIYYTYD